MRVMETALSADVLALLETSDLPTEDLRAGRPITFLAASLNGELLGCVGYESSRDVVLLRSLALRSGMPVVERTAAVPIPRRA